MTKATGMTGFSEAAKLVKAYAVDSLMNSGEDEKPDALTRAALDEKSDYVVCKIGEAMLERTEYLADAAYRFGGENYDPRLEKIASLLWWTA